MAPLIRVANKEIPVIKHRLSALLAIALLAACGGVGPDADMDKSPDEIRKAAEGMSVDELEDVIEKYGEAIKNEKDAARLADLQKRSGIYSQALTKKKMGGG